jgi:hypothetical protein
MYFRVYESPLLTFECLKQFLRNLVYYGTQTDLNGALDKSHPHSLSHITTDSQSASPS